MTCQPDACSVPNPCFLCYQSDFWPESSAARSFTIKPTFFRSDCTFVGVPFKLELLELYLAIERKFQAWNCNILGACAICDTESCTLRSKDLFVHSMDHNCNLLLILMM